MIRRPQSSQSNSPTSPTTLTTPDLSPPSTSFNIGFITSPFKDSKIPVSDHLHAHAYIGQPDLAGWWRRIAYSHVGWYAIEDLMAEIRLAVVFLLNLSLIHAMFFFVLAANPLLTIA